MLGLVEVRWGGGCVLCCGECWCFNLRWLGLVKVLGVLFSVVTSGRVLSGIEGGFLSARTKCSIWIN